MKIGIIGGGGWLGHVIARAIAGAGLVLTEDLGISFRSSVPSGSPAGLQTRDSRALAAWADVLIISVRPHDWPALEISAAGKLAISVMSSVRLGEVSSRLGTDRVVRALPNVAAEVSRSYTPWAGSSAIDQSDRRTVTDIFNSCGTCDEVESEEQIDYLTGLTGSGPAYAALLAEAMRRDAVSRGIPAEIATRASRSLIIGAGRLLEARPQSTEDVVEDFVAYRGVIAAAIEAMRAGGFERSVEEGLSAALQKTRALSN